MQAFAGICLILCCVAGVTLGSRLLWVWRRTRRVPELSIGITALSLSVSGALLLSVSSVPPEAHSLVQRVVKNSSLLLLAVSSISLGIGYQQIFRPRERWAVGIWLLGALLLLAWWGASVAAGDSGLRGGGGLQPALYYAGRLLIHTWGSAESFRYHALLRRRLALGLAEPMVAHSFWLWGVSGAGVVASVLVGAWASYVVVVNVLLWPFGLFALSALGLLSAVSMWWAFFPPAFYQRLVLRNTPGV